MADNNTNAGLRRHELPPYPFLSRFDSPIWPTGNWYPYGFRSGAFNYAPPPVVIPTLPMGIIPPVPFADVAQPTMIVSVPNAV